MHKSRTALLITSGLGMISTLFTWRLYDQIGEKADEAGMSGFISDLNLEAELVAENGIDIKWGFVTLALFAIIMLIAAMGKKDQALGTGSTKFALLVISATNVIYHIAIISLILIAAYKTPGFGLYIAFTLSLVAMILPYLFNKSGAFDPMTPKEIVKDIEQSADDFEDKAEEVGDKIEDSIEDKFKKKRKEEKPNDLPSDDRTEV